MKQFKRWLSNRRPIDKVDVFMISLFIGMLVLNYFAIIRAVEMRFG